MAEIRPDKALADLQAKLTRARTDAERATIQEQIDARMAELTSQVGGAAGFGARGMVVPTRAAAGTTILQPTYEEGVFTKTTITEDRSRDPYGRAPMETKVTLFDASGRPLSAAEAAKTETGLNFAAAGRDIGYGPGFIAPGVRPDIEFATFNTGRAAAENAAAAAGIVGGPTGSRVTATPTATVVSTPVGTPTATAEQRSAYALLQQEFARYGLEALVPALETLVKEGLAPAEFTLRLRETDAYKKRFAANQARIQKGLRALSEAEYINLEDQYQNVMRNYGLPANYYTRGDMGRQEGFERFIAGDVSAAELEDRIQTAQNRVINAAPEVSRALREFYPGISNGDILAYALDPEKAITDIRRKVTAAEIGAGAMQAGLATGVTRAEELARFGVTGEQARAGFQAISDILPRGRQLSEIYGRQGVSPYTQTTAEQEVFGLTGAAEAGRQRRKLTELEQAAFSGQAGAAGGALARDRAGAF